jgi:ABC-type Fe3+/spermidine/putrescine transport system ATPase subunit
MSQAALLQLDALSLAYGQVRALDNVTLEVGQGELVTLVGPSGCGKSTLLRVVAGLLTPQSGRVVLEGRDITAQSPEKRQMGWVPQNYALFEHLNVFSNVAFGLRHRRLSTLALRQRVMVLLELCQLDALAQRPVSALSGGQRQRVAVARALATQPKVLLLDEPLAALDPQLRHELRAGLKALLRESGVTTLFVTHDQTEALSLADRVAVMRDGRLEQFATPEALWSRPASPFVATFFGSATVLPSRRLNAQQLELLPGLIIALPGSHEPAIALRRTDLCCAHQGAAVRVVGCEYFGEGYIVTVQHESGASVQFVATKPLTIGSAIRINVRPDYMPTPVVQYHG